MLEQVADRADAKLRELPGAKRADPAKELYVGFERNAVIHRMQFLSGGSIHSTGVPGIRDLGSGFASYIPAPDLRSQANP